MRAESEAERLTAEDGQLQRRLRLLEQAGAELECDLPSASLYEWSGTVSLASSSGGGRERVAVEAKQLLLRGAVIMIQSHVRAHKARQQASFATISTSATQKIMNLYIANRPDVLAVQRMSREVADMSKLYLDPRLPGLTRQVPRK